MEVHKTLRMLLDSLFTNNDVKNWTIFEEKSGNVIMKIRFTNRTEHEQASDNIAHRPIPVSYKKKSEKQMSRDRDRMAQHQRPEPVMTRSRASDSMETVELPRNEENYRSDTGSLEFSPVLDIAASCSVPLSSPLNHDRTNSMSLANCSHSGSDESRSSDVTVSSIEPITLMDFGNTPSPHIAKEPPNTDKTVPKLKKCSHSKCEYFDSSFDSSSYRDPDIDIYSCDKCQRFSGCPTFVCKSCLDIGSHKGHLRWLHLAKPD